MTAFLVGLLFAAAAYPVGAIIGALEDDKRADDEVAELEAWLLTVKPAMA